MSKDRKNRITVRDIAITGILLAICIVFQIFKNMSVFITGPVVNACLIICALSTGLIPAMILSVITPVTSVSYHRSSCNDSCTSDDAAYHGG
jgi:hypothetical protein